MWKKTSGDSNLLHYVILTQLQSGSTLKNKCGTEPTEKKSRQLSTLHMQMQRRGRRNNAPHYVVLILQPSPHLEQIGCVQLCSF